MDKFKSLPTKHPLTFGLLILFVFILMLIVSAILGNLLPGGDIYAQPGGILARSICIVILLALLSRLGWLRSAGFTSLGGLRTWLIILLLLVYSILGSAYVLTRSIEFNTPNPARFGLVAVFILIGAFMEEVAFRGLILHGFVRAWGSADRGTLKSILVSALFFCSIHILDFLGGRPLTAVLPQSLEAYFLGVFLGALVLNGKSIYPAAIFHGILNLGAYLIFASRGLEPTPISWLWLSLLMVPLALFGIYLLRGVTLRLSIAEGV